MRQEGGETGRARAEKKESESRSKSETLRGSTANPLWHKH